MKITKAEVNVPFVDMSFDMVWIERQDDLELVQGIFIVPEYHMKLSEMEAGSDVPLIHDGRPLERGRGLGVKLLRFEAEPQPEEHVRIVGPHQGGSLETGLGFDDIRLLHQESREVQ